MLKREFHNSVNEIFSNPSCDEEIKIKCNLNGFDYEFCKEYYNACVRIGEGIKIGTHFPQSYTLNTDNGKMKINLISSPQSYNSWSSCVPINEEPVEIEYFFIDEVLIESIAMFTYGPAIDENDKRERKEMVNRSLETYDSFIKEMEEKHGKGK